MNKYCIIMAGGVGSRFWPKSTEKTPKQFLDVLGTGKTLIRQTFERFSRFVPAENILVVTNSLYKSLVAQQLPEIPETNILIEPFMRNTAPCLAYAIKKIESIASDAVMIVTPADHLVSKVDEFERVINKGIDFVAENDAILTIGIEPNRPNTGYGYIEYRKTDGNEIPVSVLNFKEKPDLQTAKKYVSLGNYSWNSGMFLWNMKTILNSFYQNAPDVISNFETSENIYNSKNEQEFIDEVYAKCPSISVDYAILEKADNVFVINTDIGWSDIGTWASIEKHISNKENDNAVISGQTLMEESFGNIVSLSDEKILVTKGLHDFIVVETDKVLMIVSKEYEQDIKQLRSKVADKFGNELV